MNRSLRVYAEFLRGSRVFLICVCTSALVFTDCFTIDECGLCQGGAVPCCSCAINRWLMGTSNTNPLKRAASLFGFLMSLVILCVFVYITFILNK